MIKITFNNDSVSFRPGETIQGVVEWSELDPETIDVRLIWYTSGKGDRDVEVVAAQTVNPQANQRSEFQFRAPSYPYSFSGKLISLIWAIEVIAFPEREAQIAEIAISPTGSEILFSKSPEAEKE